MRTIFDILEITNPDPYSVEFEVKPELDNDDPTEPRLIANLGKSEVIGLIKALVDISKNMKE